jgi:hypothetical protein
MVRLEGLSKLKKFNDLIGTQIRDLPACSIVPQLITLPCAPILLSDNKNSRTRRVLSKHLVNI